MYLFKYSYIHTCIYINAHMYMYRCDVQVCTYIDTYIGITSVLYVCVKGIHIYVFM